MSETETIRVRSDSMGVKRHEFLQANGSWLRCAGPGRCRECNRARAEKEAK